MYEELSKFENLFLIFEIVNDTPLIKIDAFSIKYFLNFY